MLKALATRICGFCAGAKSAKNFSSKKLSINYAAIGVSAAIAAMIAVLYPIVLLGFRNAPNCDDFTYGQLPHFSYLNGDSLWKLLEYAWITVKDTFVAWQGTYSAVFLFALHPGVFGDEWYFITTVVMLASILMPLLFLYVNFGNKNAWAFIGIIIWFIFMVSYCPSPAQGLFWWNGAIYYTFFWSAACSLMICLVKNKRNMSIRKTLRYMLAAFFIAGGNFIVALTFVMALFFLTIYDIYETRQVNLRLVLILLLTVIGLMVSCIAPGNAYRQALNEKQTIVFSVYWALRLAARHFIWYFDWKFVGFMLMAVALLVRRENFASGKINFKPFLFFAFCSGSIFALMFFPWVYATGMVSYIPERIENILFYTFVSLGIINTVWLVNILVDIYNPRFLAGIRAAAIVLGAVILLVNINLDSTTTAKALQGLQQETNATVEVFMHYETKWVLRVSFAGETEQVPFSTYRVGAVTFVSIAEMSQYLGRQYNLDDFSRHYEFYGDTFVPLQEACAIYHIKVVYSDDNEGIVTLTLP